MEWLIMIWGSNGVDPAGWVALQLCTPRPVILTEGLRGFLPSQGANAGTVPQIRLEPLPSKSLPIHY
jgi:hypothetical protein